MDGRKDEKSSGAGSQGAPEAMAEAIQPAAQGSGGGRSLLPWRLDSSSWHWQEMGAARAWVLSWLFAEEAHYAALHPGAVEAPARAYRFASMLRGAVPELAEPGPGVDELLRALVIAASEEAQEAGWDDRMERGLESLVQFAREADEVRTLRELGSRPLSSSWARKATLASGGDLGAAVGDLKESLAPLAFELERAGEGARRSFSPYWFPRPDGPWGQGRADDELRLVAAAILAAVDDPGIYGHGPAGAAALLSQDSFMDELCMYDRSHPAAFFIQGMEAFIDEELEPIRAAAVRHLLPFA